MNNLIWKVHGISNHASVACLKRLISDHNLSLLLLLETLFDPSDQSDVASKLCLTHFVCNSNGEIWIFLWPSINVYVNSHTDELLHVGIYLADSSIIHCTFIYAKYNYIERRSLWVDIGNLSSPISGPWLVGLILSCSKCF